MNNVLELHTFDLEVRVNVLKKGQEVAIAHGKIEIAKMIADVIAKMEKEIRAHKETLRMLEDPTMD